MLQDLQTSKDLSSAFRALHHSNPSKGRNILCINDSYRVLSSASAWHLRVPETDFTAPVVVQETCVRFAQFYDTQHKGRKLTWQWQLCEGELIANYVHLDGKPYQFRVSAYQMAILLLFNDASEVQYEYIKASTQLNGSVLDRSIASLVKFRVLDMHPPTPAEELSYSLNHDFRSKKVRLNLIVTSKSQKTRESEETNRAIVEERRLVIKVSSSISWVFSSLNEISAPQPAELRTIRSQKLLNPRTDSIVLKIVCLCAHHEIPKADELQRVSHRSYSAASG